MWIKVNNIGKVILEQELAPLIIGVFDFAVCSSATKIYVIGGKISTNYPVSYTQEFDLETLKWTLLSPSKLKRHAHSAVYMK